VTAEIAIVGVGCRYPDARSPDELWHNALAGRRAFRAIPEARLRVADYAPRFADDPDSTYVRSAALIEDFELDRQRFKIAGATARATDLVHWLALDVADRALRDAGFPAGDGLPRASTGVIVGNSLTGEMSRAAGLRLRWPYVARILAAALARTGGDAAAHAALIDAVERDFKAALPPPNEDSLAGGLSNTIAGRICNAFDLGGGGFTVDGACSSSLLAIAQACSALAAGDLDLAIAGGVDVSLDPFELIGFARLGALAHGAMRIYDRSPTGFLPGEGAGMVVLARRDDAEARKLRIHAVIRGWGIASDGLGGITRPDPAGHRRAIARCYARAGFGIETVALVEGHGTGTAVGDEAELAAIAGAVREAGARRPAAIGSIKALIGHTKAAAGVAGLLKATAAVRDRLIPPAHGVDDPHAELARADAVLRAPAAIEEWPDAGPARAGVSAIGFGGINVHVVVEGVTAAPRRAAAATRRLATTAQDVELLVLSAADPAALAARASALATRAGGASLAELTDLAAGLAARAGDAPVRAAVVAATPDEARLALEDIARRCCRSAAGSRASPATTSWRPGAAGSACERPTPPDRGSRTTSPRRCASPIRAFATRCCTACRSRSRTSGSSRSRRVTSGSRRTGRRAAWWSRPTSSPAATPSTPGRWSSRTPAAPRSSGGPRSRFDRSASAAPSPRSSCGRGSSAGSTRSRPRSGSSRSARPRTPPRRCTWFATAPTAGPSSPRAACRPAPPLASGSS